MSTPSGIRTRAAAVKGRCPRPLDDGSLSHVVDNDVVVGLPGFEPGTSASRTQRANQAALQPVVGVTRDPSTLLGSRGGFQGRLGRVVRSDVDRFVTLHNDLIDAALLDALDA